MEDFVQLSVLYVDILPLAKWPPQDLEKKLDKEGV